MLPATDFGMVGRRKSRCRDQRRGTLYKQPACSSWQTVETTHDAIGKSGRASTAAGAVECRQPNGTSPVIKAMELGGTKAAQRRVEKPGLTRSALAARFALAVSDPQPMTEVARFWRTAAQSATIGMFVILLVVALSLARPLLLPVASAFVVTMMLGPLSARAERYQIPIAGVSDHSLAARDRGILWRDRSLGGAGRGLDRQSAGYRPQHSGKAARS